MPRRGKQSITRASLRRLLSRPGLQGEMRAQGEIESRVVRLNGGFDFDASASSCHSILSLHPFHSFHHPLIPRLILSGRSISISPKGAW
ncbi:hypothetical protein GGTG_06798 [Gaeumannomyces tritici R3-111a-1]|uniref:Uncharacterized protein n=1 Tax=Gaeumannomyces tritici (strain R3-111a-1) TaxID=644352 RepID=J3NZV1_GAET3|nr:hypothetical protein GGTG_06798 [Gaeumannomyces tritici R3-111a-1]EJT76884.1 hypothetical protein GGTG_06798 [Gaeumannomyces tritici R3-111a-1]